MCIRDRSHTLARDRYGVEGVEGIASVTNGQRIQGLFYATLAGLEIGDVSRLRRYILLRLYQGPVNGLQQRCITRQSGIGGTDLHANECEIVTNCYELNLCDSKPPIGAPQ